MSRYLTTCCAFLVGFIMGAHEAAAQCADRSNIPDSLCRGIDMSAEAGVSDCLASLAEKQDKTLNQNYQKLVKLIKEQSDWRYEPAGPDVQPQSQAGAASPQLPSDVFRQAQEAWLKFRDLQCLSEELSGGGSSGSVQDYQTCLCYVTFHRNKDLERVISEYE